MLPEAIAILMFVVTFAIIFRGYPVAFTLGGCSLLFFFVGVALDYFSFSLLKLIPSRIFGIMSNNILLAIPYFIFMGNILDKSGLAKDMLSNIGKLFGSLKGGLGATVIIVGALLAASTSIVAASVITMGVISLPLMLEQGYSKKYTTGVIVASGTLGQIIPPSIVLIVLADQMGISVGDLFKGAMFPGILLTLLYLVYTFVLGKLKPSDLPLKIEENITTTKKEILWEVIKSSVPPLLLIVLVLGSIFTGVATVSEAGAVGAMGAYVLAKLKGRIGKKELYESADKTVTTVSMVLFLLIGSTVFALVFRAYNGDLLLEEFLLNLPGGKIGLILFSSLFVFILGFFIDFFEIIFIIIPLLVPAAIALDVDLVWFAIIISMNLQTSFLTPPFGFSIFFLKGVAPPEISTKDIYKGVIPFIALQVLCMVLVYVFPELVSW